MWKAAYKICFVFAILALPDVVRSASYSVVDLGVLEGLGGIVRGLNNANELVGGSKAFGRGKRAFIVTSDGAENLIGFPSTDSSVAHAINDDPTVVGSSNTNTASSAHAFIWTRRDGVQDLGTLPGDSGSEALGINRHGEAVGYSSGRSGIQAVMWRSDRTIESLGRLRDGDHSKAFAINQSGDVAGTSERPGANRAFIWTRNRGMENLGVLPGDSESAAIAINNPGRVVGYSSGARGSRAFFWTRNRGMEDLGTLLGDESSRAFAINEPGDIVGTSGGPAGQRATLWPRGGGVQDLNALIVPGNFVLTHAVNINNPGAILAIGHDLDGFGNDHDHDDHELPVRIFLLIP
jgi:probable HAF family extracellular repeat protein